VDESEDDDGAEEAVKEEGDAEGCKCHIYG
jgi:hypothetical protein